METLYHRYTISCSYFSVLNVKDTVDLYGTVLILFQACTGDKGLDLSDRIQEIVLSSRIQFGQNIVQKKDRIVCGFLLHQLDLRELQGEGGGSLLSL